MPELPEVETVVRGLRQSILHETIRDAEVLWEKSLSPPEAPELMAGQSIHQVSRRAKYIVIHLDRGCLIVHLRMTGKLSGQFSEEHLRVIMHFESGRSLYFRDTRKFGRMIYTTDPERILGKLGPEPLDDDFRADLLYAMLRSHKRSIKPLLLDQTFMAGLGNIYVDEALYLARIHPQSLSSKIPKQKVSALHAAIRHILSASIRAQGTTVLNFSHGDDLSGSYQAALKVYGREGEACDSCGKPVQKIQVAQRGTHFCRYCQQKYR